MFTASGSDGMAGTSSQKSEPPLEIDADIMSIDISRLDEQPSLEECCGQHDFQVEIAKTGKSECYVSSSKTNRIFTSTDKLLTFSISTNPLLSHVIRIMLVCSNRIFQPLSRCSYHLRGDNTTFRDHVVTHKDAAAQYVGTAHGAYFRDRLAILVPIEETGHKSISLEFKCLSSCYKIRKITTVLIFTLEDKESDRILARKIFNFHVSKNFKRDAEVAEKTTNSLKRPMKSSSPLYGDTLIDLSDLKFILPQEFAREVLETIQQYFKAKLYSTMDESRDCLTVCLEKIDNMIENFDSNYEPFRKA